jgi:hypothetical protein
MWQVCGLIAAREAAGQKFAERWQQTSRGFLFRFSRLVALRLEQDVYCCWVVGNSFYVNSECDHEKN